MNIVEKIYQEQARGLAIHIGIDGMNVKNELKQRILDALMNEEDFALLSDEGNYAYFLQEGFMVYKSDDGKSDNVTHLTDKPAWSNALKVTMLGHKKFVSQKALQLNANYLYLKDGLKQETAKLITLDDGQHKQKSLI